MGAEGQNRRIAITGVTGFMGSALAQSLRADGWQVIGVSRRAPAPGSCDLQWDPAVGKIDASGFEGLDAVVHLAGESVTGGRWTPERKEAIRRSRTDSTALLARTLAGLQAPPRVLLSGSAIGYYGDTGDAIITEESPPGSDFLATVSREWEAACEPAREAGIRLATMRTGIVLGEGGGALEKMVPPFRIGVGGVLGSGRQWMSWIALPDILLAMKLLLENDVLSGPFNLVGPNPVTNAEFTRTLGKVLHRPTILPVPAFAVRLLFGEMGDAIVLHGARIVPNRLLEAGMEFQYPQLEAALKVIPGLA